VTQCAKAPNRAEYTGTRTTVWLNGAPIMLAGLEEWLKVGDRYEIDGELWRVVEVSDRFALEREPS